MSKGGRLSRLFPKLFRNDKDKATADRDLKGPVCLVLFLDDTEQRVSFKANWKGQVFFDLVCDQANIFEKDYFGLRFVDTTGQTHWVELGKSLSSQLKSCSTPHKFYFCVKFYAADPCKLKEEITRYLFFLQVKRDILQGRLPVTFDEAAELCAYAVQSELGDFDPGENTPGYVSEFHFVPNQTEELESRIAAMHRRCLGATPLMAEHRFLEKSKWLEMYGVDLHPVQGESNVEYFLGLTPTGIVVYKHKTKVASYFWPRVTKASHKSKIFMIKVKDKNNDEHVYAFELSSKSACKHLWKCCLEHHAFFRLTQAKDKETRPTKVLRSLSNSSHRGRSERRALGENIGRQEPSVARVASRRQQRRVNSESKLNAEQLYSNGEGGLITLMGKPQPVRAPRHRSLPELQGKESPRSVKSAPWESKYDYGLYTSGHESPAEHTTHHSRRSRAVSGSDSESGISQRKKYFPSRKESDNESDGSATRRRRREMDSDSGSEVSFTNSGRGKRQNMGTLKDHNRNELPILYPFHDKDNNKNGSIPSLHSAPVGEFKQQRRRRRRSKSPGNSKQFPEELKQHIDFNLIETDGMTENQLQDINYTKVETKSNLFRVKYSPKFRQKIWASRRKSFGDVDRQSESSPKGSSSTLGRQDSRNTDPAGAYGGYTTHGGSSVDERPPAYNTVHPSSGNLYGDTTTTTTSTTHPAGYSQSGYESRGSHISSSSRHHSNNHHPHPHHDQQQLPPPPYHVVTSPKAKQPNKESYDASDSNTLVSGGRSVKTYASRGAKSDVLQTRRLTNERERQLYSNSISVTDVRHFPTNGQNNVGHNRNNEMDNNRYSPSQGKERNRFVVDDNRNRSDQDFASNNGQRNQNYVPKHHHHHQHNHHHSPSQPHHYHHRAESSHRFSSPNSCSPSLPVASALDASSSPSYRLSRSNLPNANIDHVPTTHHMYLSNPTTRLLDAGSNQTTRLLDNGPGKDTIRGFRQPPNQDFSTINSGRDQHPNHQHSLPQHSQAHSSAATTSNRNSNPQHDYHSPVSNSKGVSASSQHGNHGSNYLSGNLLGSDNNYNSGNSDTRSSNRPGYNRVNNTNSQQQRQPAASNSSSNRNSNTSRTEYGRQTPSRNLYQDFQDAAATHAHQGESPSSPSRSVGVTANSSITNSAPRSRPLSYHNHHQTTTPPPRSDYASSHGNQQQQQYTPPRSQQNPAHYQTPPRMHQQQTSVYGQPQQTPPRSQYSTRGQLRGGSSARSPGLDYRNRPPPPQHESSQPSSNYHPHHTPPPPNYNTSQPNQPDSAYHMRGHSGQSVSSSGYSGSHSHQSAGTATPGSPSGFVPRQSGPGNQNTAYTSQRPSSNPVYNQRQSSNSDMGQGQAPSQGHPHSQPYSSTPRRVYRSDLVTEL